MKNDFSRSTIRNAINQAIKNAAGPSAIVPIVERAQKSLADKEKSDPQRDAKQFIFGASEAMDDQIESFAKALFEGLSQNNDELIKTATARIESVVATFAGGGQFSREELDKFYYRQLVTAYAAVIPPAEAAGFEWRIRIAAAQMFVSGYMTAIHVNGWRQDFVTESRVTAAEAKSDTEQKRIAAEIAIVRPIWQKHYAKWEMKTIADEKTSKELSDFPQFVKLGMNGRHQVSPSPRTIERYRNSPLWIDSA